MLRVARPHGADAGDTPYSLGVRHSDEPSPKTGWVEGLPTWPPAKDGLAPLVEVDHDEAETEYYEAFADPTFVLVEREQRRYRGAFRRRLRRRSG